MMQLRGFCARVAIAALLSAIGAAGAGCTGKVVEQAEALRAEGKVAEAMGVLRDALKEQPGDRALSRALAYTAEAYAREVNVREAWVDAVNAYDDYLELAKDEDPRAHRDLVKVLLDCRGFAEAAAECTKALERYPDDVEYMARLGFALQQQGKYELADPFLQEAADRSDASQIQWWRADNERLLGEYKKSLAHFEVIKRSGMGLMNPAFAQHYRAAQWLAEEQASADAMWYHLNTGERHDYASRNDRRVIEAHTALRLAPEQRGQREWRLLGDAHLIVGQFMGDLGKFDDAQEHLLAAVAAYEKGDPGQLPWAYQSLANIYDSLANVHPDREKEYREKGLAAHTKEEESSREYRQDHMARHALADKASALADMYGADDERVKAARGEVARLIPSGGPPADCSIAANVSAEFYFRYKERDFKGARELAEILVPYYETQFNMEMHLSGPGLFYHLADMSLGEQHYDDAVSWCVRGTKRMERMRGLLGSDEFRRQIGANTWQELYALLIKIHVARRDEAAAFDAAEQYKARALLDMLASREPASKHPPSDAPEPAAAPDPTPALPPAEERMVTALRDLKLEQNAYARLPEDMAPGNIRIRTTKEVPVLLLGDLQPLMKDFTYVSYVLGNDDAAVVVLSAGEVHAQRLEGVSTKSMKPMVDSFRKCIMAASEARRDLQIDAQGDQAAAPAPDAELQSLLQQLYGLLMAPIAPYIKTSALCISADGLLNYIPFEILQREGRYLVEDYAISYAPSANVLKHCLDQNRTRHQSILAFGNPNLQNPAFRLLNAETEVCALRDVFAKADIFVNNDATEAVVKERAGAYDIVHFACHGELNLDNPMLTSLRLAPGAGEDGYLHAGEVFGLDLGTPALVVLSACSSGLGELSSGNELMGLTRSFLYAGAPAIIASLWNVDDRSTSELMQAFYANLNTMTKTESLRQAKLALMKKCPHPFHWAPFCLQGDYR